MVFAIPISAMILPSISGATPMSTTIEAIETAISKLPPSELAEFRNWFAEFDAANWDKQIEADVSSGKLEALASEALAEYHSGKARPL
jgi:hypothetical protein